LGSTAALSTRLSAKHAFAWFLSSLLVNTHSNLIHPLFIDNYPSYTESHAGGGGERVLWTAIRCIQEAFPHVHCVIYTGDLDASSDQILRRAQQRFGVELPRPVDFVYLHSRYLVEAQRCVQRLVQLGWSCLIY
jgi:hypothetical protein